MTFKERYRDLQELVREYLLIRKHNLKFKEGDPQQDMLMFAEGALVLIILERFLRVIPAVKATADDTLYNLLQRATGGERPALKLAAADRERAIKEIKDVRNTIMHGNYEQAAAQAGCATVIEYFKTQFAGEIEALYKLVDGLMKQIDQNTGESRQAPGA